MRLETRSQEPAENRRLSGECRCQKHHSPMHRGRVTSSRKLAQSKEPGESALATGRRIQVGRSKVHTAPVLKLSSVSRRTHTICWSSVDVGLAPAVYKSIDPNHPMPICAIDSIVRCPSVHLDSIAVRVLEVPFNTSRTNYVARREGQVPNVLG